jgi:hypothetical protein
MGEVQICELHAGFSALVSNGLGLFALGYDGYITHKSLANVTMVTKA